MRQKMYFVSVLYDAFIDVQSVKASDQNFTEISVDRIALNKC